MGTQALRRCLLSQRVTPTLHPCCAQYASNPRPSQCATEHILISYSRGLIRVLDRSGLQAAACECFLAVKKTYERIVG
jgi:hypothetical protein